MRYILFLIFLASGIVSKSQPLISKEFRNLSDRIFRELHFNDSLDTEDHKPEYIQYILKVDSSGQISSTHILTDPRYTGTLFTAVSSIPFSVFAGWKSQKAKQRTIIFPIYYCPENGCPLYIADLVRARDDRSIQFKIINETVTTITLTAIRSDKPRTVGDPPIQSFPVK